ncbi:MAG: hypothetical protein Q7S45_01675 [Candidatus Curtissbacteria bacterium]|nr:hypothetical protein [Candidatus Curtissbacteria bacterium]
MADLTIKEIEEVLDKKLDQKLEPIKKTLDEHSKKLNEHDGQFRSIKKTLDEHSQRLESIFPDMVDVQKKTDILPDIYDIVKGTKEKVDDHEERLGVLEHAA